jgi:hypothetical protein
VGICPKLRNIPANTWMMISPPAMPETITSVIGNTITVGSDLGNIDEMGGFEFRTYKWYPNVEDDDLLAKYRRPGTITSGEAYWFKVYGNYATLIASENPNYSTQTISLLTGWNMLANPYNFMVKKEALNLGTTTEKLWAWTGERYESSDCLIPWKGYFFYPEEESTITISPIPYDEKDGSLSILSIDKGIIKLIARGGKYSDEGIIGFCEKRKSSHKPPIPFGEFVRLSVNGMYEDIREIKDVNVFNISIANNTGNPVTLSWQGDFPDGYDAWLIDGNNAIDMRENSKFKIQNSKLKIKIMKPGKGLVIETLEITNVITYPNPAKNNVIVRISAKTSNASLRMEVYNILGQKATSLNLSQAPNKKWATFEEKEQAYIYEAGYSCTNTFNERLSNGLYFLKITASENSKETSKLGRMIIKK